MSWIEGNVPKCNCTELYWISTKIGTTIETYYMPVRYSDKLKGWFDLNGNQLSSNMIVAYAPIHKPRSYTEIGNGLGYYIKTISNGKESIYGLRLQPANWIRQGYDSESKAKIAAKRLIKLDEKEKHVREIYQIIDGKGQIINTILEKEN